jgi:integrase
LNLPHLIQHGRQYWYDRGIPARLRRHFPEPHAGKTRYRIRLDTTDATTAARALPKHDALFQLLTAKAQRLVEGHGDDAEAREIDALALELRGIEDGGGAPEDASPLPDEVREQALYSTPTHLRARFLKTYRTGRAPVGIADRLEDWIAHNTHVKPRTTLERRTAIQRLHKWAKGREPLEITRDIAREYAQYLHKTPAVGTSAPPAVATVTKQLQALSAYWRHLAEEKIVPDGLVWAGLHKRKAKAVNADEEERPFTDAEVGQLLGGGARPLLHDAMRIALLTGARASELGRMRVRHVALGKMTINVPGTKTQSAPRVIPLHRDLVTTIGVRIKGKQLDDYILHELPDDTKLKHGRTRAATLSQAFTRYRRKAGVDDHIEGHRRARTNLHSCRRWLDTKLLEAGVNGDVIDAMLGWKRQGMRARYSVNADFMALMRAAMAKVRLPVREAKAG